ncbi:uncharacterized protein LOC144327178 [Podarcis muralis]
MLEDRKGRETGEGRDTGKEVPTGGETSGKGGERAEEALRRWASRDVPSQAGPLSFSQPLSLDPALPRVQPCPPPRPHLPFSPSGFLLVPPFWAVLPPCWARAGVPEGGATGEARGQEEEGTGRKRLCCRHVGRGQEYRKEVPAEERQEDRKGRETGEGRDTGRRFQPEERRAERKGRGKGGRGAATLGQQRRAEPGWPSLFLPAALSRPRSPQGAALPPAPPSPAFLPQWPSSRAPLWRDGAGGLRKPNGASRGRGTAACRPCLTRDHNSNTREGGGRPSPSQERATLRAHRVLRISYCICLHRKGGIQKI